MRSCTRKRERGMTLVLVAMCIFVFIGIAALAVDVGMLFTARTSAQHAADAGALAGAYVFVNPPNGGVTSTYIQNVAATVANQNNVLGTPAGITTADVTVYMSNQRVTVNVPRTAARGNAITLFFARIFGLMTSDIAASATAEASTAPTGGRCIRPIFIPNTALAGNASPAPATATDACNASPPDILLNTDGTGTTTAFGNSQIGQQFVLKNNAGGGSIVPSQYAELNFGSGANTYSCLWSSCITSSNCAVNPAVVPTDSIQCANSYPVLTGDKVGPTMQGVTALIGSSPDTWQGIGEYVSPSGQILTDSRSLTVAPVWDDCAQPLCSGKSCPSSYNVKVIGFVEIFVDGFKAGDVTAHLVRPLGCNGTGTGNGPFATPIRLVQAPPTS